ncbi:ParB/RepB/Spo0J family partition protein [Hydrogenoanaerobacterium sp.]|uniref:ParB/RepB/Spo0J family partition protein n=1 Tax=Hydrogenoanaerobacterium sp. TaxID=2953763 RepID=UPI0028A18973|nr:ParB/RepB/Spo0J family partition protein [Hydrogenoanaerobacterium sp.]
MIFTKNRSGEQVVLLPVECVVPNPAQPRTVFDSAELDKLAQSIRQNGLLQPITVRKLSNERYELISGERRLKACKQLGMDKIKAIVANLDDKQSAVFALIENLQREDLNFFDEARGIYELIYQWSITQEEAASKLGMAQSTLANKLRILRLPAEVQQRIAESGLTERHARALLKLKISERQQAAIEIITKKSLNVAQTERMIDDMLAGKPKPPKRLLIVKDLRIFINTIDRAISTMKQAGIDAVVDQNDYNDYIEYTVKIPKTSAYQQKRRPPNNSTTLFKVSI